MICLLCISLCSGGDLMTAATELIDKCGSKMIAITDGASGSILTTHKDVSPFVYMHVRVCSLELTH